ncbi:unnamed protein product [marine sediment metagenome]|uniref:Uncharacterized protein n=1 Tax=marine sediment metagenome TaxID=412755 RepID=X0WCG3_9ZZZZ
MATFGLDSGDGYYSAPANYANAMRFQNDAGTGTLTDLEILFDDTSPNGNVKMAIYEDNPSEQPDARLLAAGEVAVANGWVKISSLSLAVTLNTYYWFAFDLSAQNRVRRQSGAPDDHHYYLSLAYANFPHDPWGGPGSSDNYRYVMRATVTVSGVARRIFITHT